MKSRLALNASVRRDGAWKTVQVPSAELVPGDTIKLSLGAVAAADVKIIDGSVLLDVTELIEVQANQRTKGYWVGSPKGKVSGLQLGFTLRCPFDCVLAP